MDLNCPPKELAKDSLKYRAARRTEVMWYMRTSQVLSHTTTTVNVGAIVCRIVQLGMSDDIDDTRSQRPDMCILSLVIRCVNALHCICIADFESSTRKGLSLGLLRVAIDRFS